MRGRARRKQQFEARAQTKTHARRRSVPTVSSPVARNNSVEANHQAATNTRGLRSLSQRWPAGPACQHSTAGQSGICTRRRSASSAESPPRRHLQLHCVVRRPRRNPATKHRKQLVAGKATQKSDLDGSCILLGGGWEWGGVETPLTLLCFLPII